MQQNLFLQFYFLIPRHEFSYLIFWVLLMMNMSCFVIAIYLFIYLFLPQMNVGLSLSLPMRLSQLWTLPFKEILFRGFRKHTVKVRKITKDRSINKQTMEALVHHICISHAKLNK